MRRKKKRETCISSLSPFEEVFFIFLFFLSPKQLSIRPIKRNNVTTKDLVRFLSKVKGKSIILKFENNWKESNNSHSSFKKEKKKRNKCAAEFLHTTREKATNTSVHPGDFSSVINDYESGILDPYYVAPPKYPGPQII